LIKRDFGDQNIKSPSIKVENIWTRISNNSKPKHPNGEKQESHSVVQSLLSEILQSLPTKECENDIVSKKPSTIKKIDTTQEQKVVKEAGEKNGEKKIAPMSKLVRAEQSNVRIVTVKPVSTPEKRPANNDVESCSKRQKTPPKDTSVPSTPKKSWIDFITFEKTTPEPVKEEPPKMDEKNMEKEKVDIHVTCEKETPLVGEEENQFVDEEEDHLNYEQQLNSRQGKEPESPINFEINEECEKQELNEELNVVVKSTNASLVNECKDEFEEDRAMKTPDFGEESSNEQDTQSDSEEEDIWSSINQNLKICTADKIVC
jgi:hypothetical protein